jgi:hypothetical protein
MGSPFDGEAAISPGADYARHGCARKVHRQDASSWMLVMIALLTVVAMLTFAAIKQKDSHDKRILLAPGSVAILCSAKRCG